MIRPRYENGAAWRCVAIVNFLLLPLMLAVAVVRYGIPVLWEDLPGTLRTWGKTLWTGRPGPWDGCVW